MANFYPNNTTASYNPYPNINRASGIDLRAEIAKILRDQGHWVVLRKFDYSSYSQYWDPLTREAVGGPAHPYVDQLVKTRHRLVSRDSNASAVDLEAPPANLFNPIRVYYFEYNIVPKIGDQIFETTWDSPDRPPVIHVHDITERYNITLAEPYRMDSGRIEYWYTPTERNVASW